MNYDGQQLLTICPQLNVEERDLTVAALEYYVDALEMDDPNHYRSDIRKSKQIIKVFKELK